MNYDSIIDEVMKKYPGMSEHKATLYAIGAALAEDFVTDGIKPDNVEHKIERCLEYGINYTVLPLEDKFYILHIIWRCLE